MVFDRIKLLFTALGLVASLLLVTGQGCPGGTDNNQDTAGRENSPNPIARIDEVDPIRVGETLFLRGQAFGGSGGYSYSWKPIDVSSDLIEGELSSNQINFTPDEEGTFIFTFFVTDSVGNIGTDTVKVYVYDGLRVNAGNNISTQVGLTTTLKAVPEGGDGNYTFSWAPSNLLDNADSISPSFTPTATGIYEFEVTVRDHGGSGEEAKDTVQVTVAGDTRLLSLTWGTNYAAGGYQVIAKYNKALDKQTAEMTGNYRISGTDIHPTSAKLAADLETVTLLFKAPLGSTSRFDLSLDSSVYDARGEALAPTLLKGVNRNTNDQREPTLHELVWGINQLDAYRFNVLFSEAMDREAVENIVAYRLYGTSIKATEAELQSDGKTVTVTFDDRILSDDVLMDVGVEDFAKDINGNAAELSLRLKVNQNENDLTAPKVVAGSIQHAADYCVSCASGIYKRFGGGYGYRVYVEFDEVMSADDVENVNGWAVGGFSPELVELQNDGRSVILYFGRDGLLNIESMPLSVADKIDIGLNSLIRDINGNPVDELNSKKIDFAPNDTNPPHVAAIYWASNYAPDGYGVDVLYNEAMDGLTAGDRNNYRISGSYVPDSTYMPGDGSSVRLILFGAWDPVETLSLSLEDNIMDINANPMLRSLGRAISKNPADNAKPKLRSLEWGIDKEQYEVIVTYNESVNAVNADNPNTYWITTKHMEEDNVDSILADGAQVLADGHRVVLTFLNRVFSSIPGPDEDMADEVHILPVEFDDDGLVVVGVDDMNGNFYDEESLKPEELRVVVHRNSNDRKSPSVTGPLEDDDDNPIPFFATNGFLIEFSEVMDAATIVPENFIIIDNNDAIRTSGDDGGSLFGSAVLLTDGRTAQVILKEDMQFYNGDTLIISLSVRDINGNSVVEDLEYDLPGDVTVEPPDEE